MKNPHYSQILQAALAATLWATGAAPASAAVSAEEAKQLGTTLTPMGAEIAGNKDGSIPAWDVNKTLKVLPNYKPKDPRGGVPYVNPYPDEKPLFSITKENMDKYLDKLDAGSVYLLKNRQGYRMDIYPTHRTIAVPDWVYENTKKCATTAKLEGDGRGFSGGHACIPFPIPKNGLEALWNGKNMPRTPHTLGGTEAYLFDSNGKTTLLASYSLKSSYPYWDNNLKETRWNARQNNEYRGPAGKAGERILAHYPQRSDLEEDMTWAYTPGLRRVRLSPEIKYDTVLTSFGGIYLADELNGFAGDPGRFDWKLKGKKEMYIQYNNSAVMQVNPDDLADPRGYPKPQYSRWELHRVWELEATLKPGARHSQSKKVFYLDEDTWVFANYAAFDSANNLVKVIYQSVSSLGAQYFVQAPLQIFDVTRGYWSVPSIMFRSSGVLTVPPFDENTWNPEAFAAKGVR